MSFLQKLQELGLWGQQPGQPQQQNPYGLNPQQMRQAAWQSVGNLGSQIMALSQQMTPAQRAAMMSRADFTGGFQQNLYNQAQMKLLQDKQRQAAEEDERTKAAKAYVAQTLQGMPDGPERRKAMAYLQLGDLPKAVETLYSTTERKAPDLKTVRVGDKDVTYQWDQGTNQWVKFGEGVAFKPEGPAKPRTEYRDGYIINLDDPTQPAVKVQGLPEEQPEQPKPGDRLALYKNYEDAPETQAYNTLAVTLGDLAGAINLDSKVSDLAFVYGVAKALDPASVVRESEGQMIVDSQGVAPSLLGQINSIVGGGALTPEKRRELFDLVRRRAGEYRKQAEARRNQTLKIGRGIITEDDLRQLPPLMDVPGLQTAPGRSDAYTPEVQNDLDVYAPQGGE